MSEKSLFCRKEVLCADGELAQLAYYCLQENGRCGILIELRKGERMEQGRADGLTSCPQMADAILELFSRNSVTPCTLGEILRDQGTNFEKR